MHWNQRTAGTARRLSRASRADTAAAPEYLPRSVRSVDGTAIEYRQLGSGPGVVLVPGGMQSAQHLMKLAVALSDRFTVYVVDRRGRGSSGSFGRDHSVARDCEDIVAVARETGALNIFGLSSGTLTSLRAALVLPHLRVALYEPPLSINGSAPTGWVPRYEREVAAGKLAQALVTVLKGIRVDRTFAVLPRIVLVPLIALAIRADDGTGTDQTRLRDLIPTQHLDMRVVADTADTLPDYASLAAPVLLLGGARSPAFLATALAGLEHVLPRARRVTFVNLGHSGPADDGRPETVAAELATFFATTP